MLPLHPQKRDVAQLVAYYVRDVGVGRSNRLIPTLFNARLLIFNNLAFAFFVYLHVLM